MLLSYVILEHNKLNHCPKLANESKKIVSDRINALPQPGVTAWVIVTSSIPAHLTGPRHFQFGKVASSNDSQLAVESEVVLILTGKRDFTVYDRHLLLCSHVVPLASDSLTPEEMLKVHAKRTETLVPFPGAGQSTIIIRGPRRFCDQLLS